MGCRRFNSWDADAARRSPQQWAVGHYFTLLIGPAPDADPAVLRQLETAGFVELFPDLYLHGLSTVLGEKETTPLTPPAATPPMLEDLPAIYVSWGAGVVAGALQRGQTPEQTQAAMHAAACNGEQRLVGTLLSPERVVEFRIGNDDEQLWADVHFVRDEGQWLESDVTDDPRPRFYHELLESFHRCPQQLLPERWGTSARLMAESLAKDLCFRAPLLPARHFVLKPEATVIKTKKPETTTQAKYVALLAGGPKDRYRELRPKLRALYDIDLRYHWEWRRPNQWRRPLPQDLNLVLKLYDMISHSEGDVLDTKATAAKLRTILIPRKLAEIRTTLEKEGIAPVAGVAPITGPNAVIPLHPERVAPPPPPKKVRTKPRHPKAAAPAPVPPAAPALPPTLQVNQGRGKVVIDCEVLELWLDERATAGGTSLASEIYQDYCAWCRTNGATPYHNTVFSQWLDRRGFTRRNRHRDGKQTVTRALTLKPVPAVAPVPPPVSAAVAPLATPPKKKSGPDYDALDLFVLEHCRVGDGATETMRLYAAFSSWCLRHKCRTMTPQAMEKHLRQQRVPRDGEQWRLTLVETTATATPPPVPPAPTPAPAPVETVDLRGKLLAQLTEIQQQLRAAGIVEVVLTPAGLNLKVQ